MSRFPPKKLLPAQKQPVKRPFIGTNRNITAGKAAAKRLQSLSFSGKISMIGVAKSLSARFKNQTVIPLGGHIFSGFRRIIFQNVINVHAVQLRFFRQSRHDFARRFVKLVKIADHKNRRPAFHRLLQNLQRLCQTSCIRLLQNAGADFRNFFRTAIMPARLFCGLKT